MIATLSEIKSILAITNTDYDNFILFNIPGLDESICEHCRNDFVNDEYLPIISSQFVFTQSDNSIALANIGDYLSVGDTIRIYETLRNDGTFTIDTVSQNKLILNDIDLVSDETVTTACKLAKISYPKPLKLVVARMMNFLIGKYDIGLKSEKIDDYSYTLDIGVSGFPTSITAPLSNYRKLFKGRGV